MINPSQGPPLKFTRLHQHNFAWFDRIMARLAAWRLEDHEDALVLSRNEIIEIIEGVKALQRK